MSDIETLLKQIRQEAEREPFPMDLPIYEAAGKNPTEAILCAGNLNSNICFFGRDLGRDEVAQGQPLIGSAGTLVRKGFYKVKERFRPFIAQLLVIYWQGTQIITLGTEAFKWFTPYCGKTEIEKFWQRSDRYHAKLSTSLQAVDSQGKSYERQVSLLPLPHPSPLNTQYYAKFPQMLQQRLNEFEF